MALDFMTALRSRAREQERGARLSGRPQTEVEAAAPYVAMAETSADRNARAKALALQEQNIANQSGQFGQTLQLQRDTLTQNARLENERLAAQREMEAARLNETRRQTDLQVDAAGRARTMGLVQSGVSAASQAYMLYKMFGKTPAAATTPEIIAANNAAAQAAVAGAGTGGVAVGGGLVGGTGEMGAMGAGMYEAGAGAGASLGSGMGAVLGGVSYAAPYYAAARAGGQLVEGIDSEGTAFSTFGESLDQPLNVERTWLGSFGVDNSAVRSTLDVLNPLGAVERAAGTVLCTELHRQGRLPSDIYRADADYSLGIDPDIIEGYHSWAVPLASLMSRSWLATIIMQPFVKAWAIEAAYRMGVAKKGSMLGKLIAFVGMPVCKVIGILSRGVKCYG